MPRRNGNLTLGVPESAVSIDVLSFPYKRWKRDGRPKNTATCYVALKHKIELCIPPYTVDTLRELIGIPFDA